MRSRASIIEEIADHLRPLKLPGSDVRPEIESHIALVVAEDPERAQFARVLTVPRLAGKASEALNALRSSLRTDLDETRIPPLFAEVRQAIDAIAPELAYLETLSGPDERLDVLKWRCALCAHTLIRTLSTRAPTSSEDSPLRAITSLVFQVVSGTRGADLKRACDSVMRFYRPEL